LIEPCTIQTSNEVNVLLPKVVRVPEGSYEHSIETPLGIASWFLVSRNDKMPYRLKLRPASLHTVLALPKVLPGSNRKDFDAVVASMPFIAGDVDR
jgi:NADH-quinone oxidoreductase subunit D